MMTNLNFKNILKLLFVFASINCAQNKADIDTINAFNLSLPSEIIQHQFDSPSYLSGINSHLFNIAYINDSSTVWIRTRMMIGDFTNRENEYEGSAQKMIDPMFNDYMDSQKLATLKAILGSVQVGAVAYLAYKHLKKYGFLKK